MLIDTEIAADVDNGVVSATATTDDDAANRLVLPYTPGTLSVDDCAKPVDEVDKRLVVIEEGPEMTSMLEKDSTLGVGVRVSDELGVGAAPLDKNGEGVAESVVITGAADDELEVATGPLVDDTDEDALGITGGADEVP